MSAHEAQKMAAEITVLMTILFFLIVTILGIIIQLETKHLLLKKDIQSAPTLPQAESDPHELRGPLQVTSNRFY